MRKSIDLQTRTNRKWTQAPKIAHVMDVLRKGQNSLCTRVIGAKKLNAQDITMKKEGPRPLINDENLLDTHNLQF